MSDRATRVNIKLTEKARKIFGDIVTEVLILADNLKELERYEEHHEKSPYEHIDLDWGDIVIKFSNGKSVQIHSSEWGEISKCE